MKKVKRDDIVKFCDEYLEADTFKDYCKNGLQLEGKEEVGKVIVGVSLSEKFIKAALNKNPDMLAVHHGLFANQFGDPPRIRSFLRNRLKLMLKNDLNLLGYHLPLDAHPKIGNNINLIRKLGLKKKCRIETERYGEIGFVGSLKSEMPFSEFVEYVNEKLDTTAFAIQGGKDKVQNIGIISGGASNNYLDAMWAGADTYLCGAIEENVVRELEETGMNFINAGHYNTERYGIQNLGELIENKFNIAVEYIDIPNEV